MRIEHAIEQHFREEFICSLLGGYVVNRKYADEMLDCAKSRGLDWKIIDKGNPHFVILHVPKTKYEESKAEDFFLKGCHKIPDVPIEGKEAFVPVGY